LVLRYVDLYGADLEGCFFKSSDLSNATFHSADLSGTNFSGAVLKSANLFSTILTDTDFSNVDFTDAKVADVEDVLDAVVEDSKNSVIFIVDDNTARLWHSKTGKELRYFEHTGIEGAIWSKDGNKILALGPSGLRLWEVDTGKIMFSLVFSEHTPISGFLLSKNEREILAWDLDDFVKLWDLTTGEELLLFDHEGIEGAFWSKDERKILTWSSSSIRLWDRVTRKINQSIEGMGKWFIDHIIRSNDEKQILIMHGTSITLFDISQGAKGKETKFSINQLYDTQDFEEEVRPFPSGVIWSGDGKKNCLAGQVWDLFGQICKAKSE